MSSNKPVAGLMLSPEHHTQLGGLAAYLRQAHGAIEKVCPVTFLGREGRRPRGDQVIKALLWALRCRLRRQTALTICGHLYLAPLAQLVGRLAVGRSILVLLGYESWQPRARRSASRFDAYASVSRLTAQRFARWSGVRRAHISVIPPRVELPEVTSQEVERYRAELGLTGQPTLLTVARLDGEARRKGHHLVLRILPELRERHPELVYLIAGDGPGRANLEREAAGLGNAVRFLGSVSDEDKAALLQLADAFVLPSEGEGYGIALAEAAVSGPSIVYSSLDASSEAVARAASTWAADPRSSTELLAAVDASLRQGRQLPTSPPGREAFEQAWKELAQSVVLPKSGS